MDSSLFEINSPDQPVQCWVYLIGAEASSVVKIGKAIDVEKRRKGLQTSNSAPLVTRWKAVGDRAMEKWLHARFKPFRLTGEWFDFGNLDPVREVRAALKEYGLPIQEAAIIPPIDDIYRERVMLGPEWDERWARPDDPDRDHPDYQPDPCGCRCFTPTELEAMGWDPSEAGRSYLFTGRPLPGGTRCWGYNH